MKFLLLILAVVFVIYSPWFDLGKTLSSGDWPYLFTENIQAFRIPAEPPFLWLDPYYQLTAKLGVQVFSLSWNVTEKIFWFFPFLAISLISSYLFLKYLSKQFKIEGIKSSIFISLGCFIYTTNTYILMVIGGGQMGVAIAYSMIPLVLQKFFPVINGDSLFRIRETVLLSFILGVQFMFDPRISILTMFIIFLYILFRAFVRRSFEMKMVRIFLTFIIAFLINFFWMYQNISYFNQEYANATGNAGADFLSFATFSNSISLLHPNWPDNIFGKIFFMRGEFLLIPIIAYVSLLFFNISNIKIKNSMLFFALLGLVGAFFAKGVNPPLGEIYSILSGLPGFGIFRDPTKFYVLTVASYMVLLPFSILSIASWINSKFKIQSVKLQFKIQNLLPFLFIAYWLFLIRPAVSGQLTGTFKPHTVPVEYINLKDFINTKPELTKTLWVPTIERFGFNSKLKPAISAMEIFGVSSVSGVLNRLNHAEAERQLLDKEIKYIIVPYDYLREIFLADRKYDDNLYVDTVKKLKGISWLSELKNSNFGKIKVFELSY